MKIVQIIPSLGFGGAERDVARISIALKQAGEDCSVVCLYDEGHLAEQLRTAGVSVTALGCNKSYGLSTKLQLLKYLKAHKPEVVHSHLIWWVPIISRMAGISAIVVTEHGLSLWKSRSRILCEKLAAVFSCRMIAVAEAVRDIRVKQWGIPAKKVVTIPNCLDTSRFNFEVDTVSVKNELGIEQSRKIILSVGSLLPVKGYRYLLEAACEIFAKIPDVDIVLAGDGELLSELKHQVNVQGIAERVKFLGYRQDIERILKASDIFVMPSLREGTSIAILEAMAANTPIVATAVGGNPEVIIDGKTGILVPPADSKALAKAIITLLTDNEQASSFARAAKERVENVYHPQKNIENLRRLYQDILEESN